MTMGAGGALQARLLKTYSSTEMAKGASVDVLFGDNIPLFDSSGRYAHVLGVFLRATTQYDVAAGGAGTMVWPATLRMAFQNVRLQDALGHVYIDNLYGDEIYDTVTLINGEPLYSVAGPSEASQVTDQTVDSSLWIPFSPGRIDSQEDFGICLPLLDNRINASAKLSFQVGTGTSLSGDTTFATWDGLTVLEAWGLVMYLPSPVVDVDWFYRVIRNDPGQEIVFPYPGASIRHIVARDDIAGTGAANMTSTYYSNWSVQVGGVTLTKGAESSVQRARAMTMLKSFDPLANMQSRLPATTQDPFSLRAETPTAIPIVYSAPRAHRTDYAVGQVRAAFTRATKTSTNYNMCGFFDYSREKAAFVAQRCGLSPEQINRIFKVMGPSGVNAALASKIPTKLVKA